MHIDIDTLGSTFVLRLAGDFDAATGLALSERLHDVLAMTTGHEVVIDTSAVKFIDSTGMQAILVADRLCRDKGIQLVLRSPSHPVARVLTLAGLDQILTIDRQD